MISIATYLELADKIADIQARKNVLNKELKQVLNEILTVTKPIKRKGN